MSDGLITTHISQGAHSVTLLLGNAVVINTGGVAAASAYTHTQSTPAASWTVNHNLGFRPAVTALSVGGMAMLAEVLHTSVNQALVSFDQPTAGLAVCS